MIIRLLLPKGSKKTSTPPRRTRFIQVTIQPNEKPWNLSNLDKTDKTFDFFLSSTFAILSLLPEGEKL